MTDMITVSVRYDFFSLLAGVFSTLSRVVIIIIGSELQ